MILSVSFISKKLKLDHNFVLTSVNSACLPGLDSASGLTLPPLSQLSLFPKRIKKSVQKACTGIP